MVLIELTMISGFYDRKFRRKWFQIYTIQIVVIIATYITLSYTAHPKTDAKPDLRNAFAFRNRHEALNRCPSSRKVNTLFTTPRSVITNHIQISNLNFRRYSSHLNIFFLPLHIFFPYYSQKLYHTRIQLLLGWRVL